MKPSENDMPFGNAKIADEQDVRDKLDLDDGKGIALGRYFKDGKAGSKLVYQGERHMLLFGPNGTGKGTRFLIPNLLNNSLNDRSIVVIDPKGELAAVTAEHRRKFSDVVLLNPFNVLGMGSAGFNPLKGLDKDSPNFFDDAAAIAEALIQISGKEPHWSESAQGLVTALVMWVKYKFKDEASLEKVRHLLTEAEESESYVGADAKPHERLIAGLTYTAMHMASCGVDAIESLSSRFIKKRDEIASIISTADTQTRWMLSEPMRDDLMKPGVDFDRLKDGDRPMTVYVILPAERLRTHGTWLRLVIVSALRALYRPGGRRTLLLLDEMAALGHLGPLEDAFGLVRGYRVQIAGILQDLSQLKALYKERWETFIANAGVVQGFAPNDLTTADWMSRRSGQKTVVSMGFNQNTGSSGGGTSTGAGTSFQQTARALFLPHDLIGLEEGSGLLWLAGMANPISFFAPPYWKIKQCQESAAPNPYYKPDEDDVG